MKIRIFGRDLFEVKKTSTEQLIAFTSSESKNEKVLTDFLKIGTNSWEDSFVSLREVSTDVTESLSKKIDKAAIPGDKPKDPELTPKELYKLKALNQEFELKANPVYVDQQIQDFKDKLSLIENYDSVKGGIGEIKSIMMRLENRKQYAKFHDFYDQYPYTMTSKINDLLKKHDYLKKDIVASFVAEMPKEAIDTMKAYNASTKELCGKEAVFYIIAKKSDFEKRNGRRDPILLAQSPFGHFWQILGAWDEEMLFVEEL